MEARDSHFLSHPIIGSPSTKRVLAMNEAETRLLENAKKGLADCDEFIGTDRMRDRCIDALFKGLEASRKLRQILSGHTAEELRRNSKENFVALLETSIPPAEDGGATLTVLNHETCRPQSCSIAELIYRVRCIYTHENDNLDEAEQTPHPIKLRWNVEMKQFFHYNEDGSIVVNAFLLLNRLREILSHFITSLDAMISFAKTGKATVSIMPPLGSIQPCTRKPREQ